LKLLDQNGNEIGKVNVSLKRNGDIVIKDVTITSEEFINKIEAANQPISVSYKKTSRKLGGSNGSIRRKKKNNSHTNHIKRS
jgi:hypothetical protein